jgi:hypothetical protein
MPNYLYRMTPEEYKRYLTELVWMQLNGTRYVVGELREVSADGSCVVAYKRFRLYRHISDLRVRVLPP